MHFSLFWVYLTYTAFRKLAPFSSSGVRGEVNYQLQGIKSRGGPRKTARSDLRIRNVPWGLMLDDDDDDDGEGKGSCI
jgi:hypothetical protein